MFKLHKNFKLIFIYLAALQLEAVKNERIVKLLEIICESTQPQAVNFTQCKVEHAARDVYEVTVAIALYLKPISNVTHSGALVKLGYENRKPMVEYKVDVCTYFRNKRHNYLAKFAYEIMGLARYSNMNHSCPYDHDLLMDHYPFDGKAVGKVLPFGNGIFTFITKWYAYNILRAVVKVRFETSER